jgi:uncharacterized protein (DUF58 family)
MEQRLAGVRVHLGSFMAGRLSGLHRSAQPGISVEFSDHKEYSPGDDIRHLNWRVYARSDKFYIRQFARETHAAVHLLLDHSASMHFRNSELAESKATFAVRLCALLSYLFLRQNDAVGLLTVAGQSLENTVPARSHASQLITIQDTMAQVLRDAGKQHRHEGPTSLSAALEYLIISRRISHSAVICVSDMFVDPDELFSYLAYLKSRHNTLWLIQVLDPAEFDFAEGSARSFPFDGPRLFRSSETGQGLLMDASLSRPEYMTRMREHLVKLQEGCTEIGIELHGCNTDEDPVRFLLECLAERA